MTLSTPFACPRCQAPLEQAANFCANCGASLSTVRQTRRDTLDETIAVEVDSSVDTLGRLLSEATLGEYDIYGELGRGGMAAVYLGLDMALDRKVAIKSMLPELVSRGGMVQRFKREAQTSAQLSHPHIIPIYTVKETRQLVYFVMKYIQGRSLESVIADTGPFDVRMAQVILSQVASALAYAHSKHVVHRDIKPANIMIDEDGWAIVTDFGIAKVQEAHDLTATGTAIGTPHYMSPEQFHNRPVTGASDQYSLDIVAYELLLGKKPFDGVTYAEIITQHLFEPVPNIRQLRPDVPEHVSSAIMRMLAKDPAERYPDLDAAIAEMGTPHKQDGDVVRAQMISLVKNGPQKQVRMSVPQSPIPMTGRAATATIVKPAAASTIVARPRPTAARRRRGRLVAVIGLLLLGAVSYAASTAAHRDAAIASLATTTPADTEAAPPADSMLSAVEAEAGTNPPSSTTREVSRRAAPTSRQFAVANVTQRASALLARRRAAQVVLGNLPSGATVTLDGRRQAGSLFLARAGSHDLRIEAPGFETISRRLTLRTGEELAVTFDSPTRAAPAAATQRGVSAGARGLAVLRLIVSPPATVFIDGSDNGQQSRIQAELLPGTHTVSVVRDGWITRDTAVTIAAGGTATLRLRLAENP